MIRSVAIGFGGNVGGREAVVERFRQAREAFEAIGRVRSAPLYRTAPIGPAQDDFYNTAIELRAEILPRELIAIVLELELLLGRVRPGERWGPRTIDLDVLYVDDPAGFTSDDPDIVIPHPRLAERRFVLEPLVELYGERFAQLLAGVRGQTVEHLASTW